MEAQIYDLLTPAERRRLRIRYTDHQSGKCLYCGDSLYGPPSGRVFGMELDMTLFPEGFLDHPIHLHHDKVSGLTIGAVHARCNAVLFQYEGE